MTCSLAACLDAAPQSPYSLYASYQKSSMPSIRKTLYMAVIHLEKVFDRVPRRVIWWAYCKLPSTRGWSHSNRACIKCQKWSARWLQPVWRVQCENGWSPRLLPSPPTVHHISRIPFPTVSYNMSLGKPVYRWLGPQRKSLKFVRQDCSALCKWKLGPNLIWRNQCNGRAGCAMSPPRTKPARKISWRGCNLTTWQGYFTWHAHAAMAGWGKSRNSIP